MKEFSAGVQLRHNDIGKSDSISPSPASASIRFGYDLTDTMRVALGIDNLFDEDAPYVASWIDANTDTMTYDLMGQRWYLKFTWNGQR